MHTTDRKLVKTLQESAKVLEVVESGFFSRKVIVVGDLMLDRHIWGSVNRISPEAPVPIVRFHRETQMAGGCGNVAMNLIGLGMSVSLVALAGDDESGRLLADLLRKSGVDASGIVIDHGRPTTTKTRVIGGHQQMLRLDAESTTEPGAELESRLLEAVISHIDSASAVILSDYAKGVLTESFCQCVISACRKRSIPVLVDPKGRNWGKYRGATLITPNRSELAVVCESNITDIDCLVSEGRRLQKELELKALTVTLSEEGMIHIDSMSAIRVPAMAREVFDVSGAGDTAIATLTCALAAGLTESDSLVLANIASGIVVGKVGTVPLGKSELLSELRSLAGREGLEGKICSRAVAKRLLDAWKTKGDRIAFTNGCFDILHAGHVTYLAQARRFADRLVVGLNSDASVQRLKGPTRPINPQEQRAQVLAGLESVDLVVLFEEDTPLELITDLRPDILAKGADYKIEDVVGAKEVIGWGGEVKLAELVDGLSTTRIASKIAITQQ